MKILYVENIRLPTEKAHGIQIMKMCEAFAGANNEVVLLVPKRKNDIKQDPFEFYGVKNNFQIKRLWVPNILWLGKLGFWLQSLYFAEVSAWYMWDFKPDILYSREERILLNFILIHKNIFWESHRGSWNLAARIVSKFAKKIIVISNGLKKFYINKNLDLSSKILVAPDGVDLSLFQELPSKEECRRKLGLPIDKKIIMYTGHLYDWKGAHVLAKASKFFSEDQIAVFVGGTTYDLEKFKDKYSNEKCLILGSKPYSEIPLYLKSADILVLPNSSSENIGREYTSPLKLFEYMASGVPIVVSSVPAIKEILTPEMCKFVEPDNPEKIALAINEVLNDYVIALQGAERAGNEVKKYTWQSRAKIIL